MRGSFLCSGHCLLLCCPRSLPHRRRALGTSYLSSARRPRGLRGNGGALSLSSSFPSLESAAGDLRNLLNQELDPGDGSVDGLSEPVVKVASQASLTASHAPRATQLEDSCTKFKRSLSPFVLSPTSVPSPPLLLSVAMNEGQVYPQCPSPRWHPCKGCPRAPQALRGGEPSPALPGVVPPPLHVAVQPGLGSRFWLWLSAPAW